MNSVRILFFVVGKSLSGHMLSTVVTVFCIALATGLVMSVFSLKEQAYEAFTGGAFGYDAVAGSGGELQLVLNTVYHVEASPGNIPWSVFRKLKSQQGVSLAVPYVLGDSYDGFRVIGTTEDIFSKIGVESEDGFDIRGRGRLFDPSKREAVIGSYVAQKSDLKIGSSFNPSHGFSTGVGSSHDTDFEVVGVVSATNTPHDRVIWIPVEQFYKIEGHVLRGSGKEYIPSEDEDIPDQHKEVSSVMLELEDPGAGFNIKKKILEDGDDITFAWPVGTVIADLFSKLGWFREILGFVSYSVIIVSLGAVLASVYNTIHDRRREFAVIRALGGGRGLIFKSVVTETAIITILGTFAGFFVNFMILAVASYMLKQNLGIIVNIFSFHEIYIIMPMAMVIMGVITGVIPAIRAYSTEVAENLNPYK